MNYRHIFHAGNFADLFKHAGLTAVLARRVAAPEPLCAIDTHAGAGLYDLTSAEARKSREAEAGVTRLMADPATPAVFARLKAEVQKLNPENGLRRYPGSPWLIARMLRPGDSLLACELRPDDFARLRALAPGPDVEVLCTDGYAAAPARVRPGGANLVLIDPPFERGDEYARVLACIGAILRRDARATVMVWLPLKDLETFDAFLRGLEAMDPPGTLVSEARLRALDDPLRLNGCALVLLNDPAGAEAEIAAAGAWVVGASGEAGGRARTWRL